MASETIPAWLSAWAQGELEIREQALDTLVVASGKIVACDPLVFLDGARAFELAVKPGKYKVAIGRKDGDVAFALVRFGRAKVATWELARYAGDADATAFAVDSGNACFVDADAAANYVAAERARDAKIAAKLVAAGVDPSDASAWHEAFSGARDEAGGDTIGDLVPTLGKKDHAAAVLDADSGANLVAFKSGAGDGVYPAFFGLDARGKPAALLIDFHVMEPAATEERAEQDDEDDLLDDEDWDLDDEDFDPAPARPEKAPASPLLPRAKAVLAAWEKGGRIALEEDCDRDALAEALLEKLVSLEGHRHLGAHLSEWLMERGEVEDIFATDDDLENDLRNNR